MGKREPSVEYLTFINHTECHCISRHNPLQSINQQKHPNSSTVSTTAAGAQSENNCQCVKHFKVFYERVEPIDEDGDDGGGGGDGVAKDNQMCRCDCDVENVSCDWLKKGKDGFSIEDRRCIVDKRCLRPACEYGQYSIQMGRCPKLEDKLAGARNLFFD